MKKSSFVAMLMGTVSGVLFALGMCMALLPEWNALTPGIVLGSIGLAFGLVTLLVWRRMTHRKPLHFSGKAALVMLVGVVGAIALGIGMCFVLVWSHMAAGIAIGLCGILVLLCLIPLIKGIKG